MQKVKPIYSYLATYNKKGEFHSCDDNVAVLRSIYSLAYFTISEEDDIPYCDKYWFYNGLKHRDDDRPAVIYSDSENMRWYVMGGRHRDHGPAVIKVFPRCLNAPCVSELRWYAYNLKHRKNGPAVIKSNGIMKWYLYGKLIKSTKNYDLSGFKLEQKAEEDSEIDIQKQYRELYEKMKRKYMKYKKYTNEWDF